MKKLDFRITTKVAHTKGEKFIKVISVSGPEKEDCPLSYVSKKEPFAFYDSHSKPKRIFLGPSNGRLNPSIKETKKVKEKVFKEQLEYLRKAKDRLYNLTINWKGEDRDYII